MDTLIRWSWVIGLAGIVALLGAAAAQFVLGTMEGAPTWFLVGGALALVLYGALDRDNLRRMAESRSFLYGSGSALMVTMVLAIAIGGYLVAREHDKTWDLTSEGDFTLSDQTVRVVEGIDEDVRVLAFYQNESEGQRRAQDLLRGFEERSARLKVEYIDPLRNPRLANEHEVTTDQGVLVLQTTDGESRRIETELTEEKLTNSLVTLLSDTQHRVCWSLGHGEPDPDDEMAERGLGVVVTELEQLNYQVTKTFVATTGIDPACEAFVVARPTADWQPYEREALAAYLAGGGRALILLEPGVTPELAGDLARYGVKVGDDVVLDFNPQNMLLGVEDPSMVVLTGDNLLRHTITRNLSAAIVMGIARSVSPLEGHPEGVTVDPLLKTSDQAWGETDQGGAEVQPDEGVELIGQVPVGVAVEIVDPAVIGVVAAGSAAPPPSEAAPAPEATAAPEAAPAPEEVAPAPEAPAAPPGDAGAPQAPSTDASRGVPATYAPKAGGKLVVLGDSDFASNVFVAWGANRDLFLNSVAWMVDEEDQIGERPEEGDTLEITAVGEAMLCLISIFLVPGTAVAFAAVTLLRRRFL